MEKNTKGTENKKTNKFEATVESIENGVEGLANKLERGVEGFSGKLEKKIENFDEEKFEKNVERFFDKVGAGFVTFFMVTLPKFARKIKNFIERTDWDSAMPLFMVIVVIVILVILVAIASGIRGLFS